MVYPFSNIFIFSFIRLLIGEIDGIKNIPKNTPFIVVSNHKQYIDPIFVIYVIAKRLNKKVHYIASPKWQPFLGDTICRKWAGCILLFNSKQAYDEAKKTLGSGEIVGIFPESFLNSKQKKLKTGAVRLAVDMNVPILPIGLVSSYIPFRSRVIIGKARYIDSSKDIKKKASKLMEEVYILTKKRV